MMLSSLRTARPKPTRRAAFTLLEVLVVVAILVILAGVASISVFRYMEDAKVGRAQADMQALEKAVKTYYTQTGNWPDPSNLAAEIGPLTEQGANCLQSPWPGVMYEYTIIPDVGPDGQQIQRPMFQCSPPGKPVITWPKR
jgi:prepilin-type N-terminal cleavage/methylation domain-containing protein